MSAPFGARVWALQLFTDLDARVNPQPLVFVGMIEMRPESPPKPVPLCCTMPMAECVLFYGQTNELNLRSPESGRGAARDLGSGDHDHDHE